MRTSMVQLMAEELRIEHGLVPTISINFWVISRGFFRAKCRIGNRWSTFHSRLLTIDFVITISIAYVRLRIMNEIGLILDLQGARFPKVNKSELNAAT